MTTTQAFIRFPTKSINILFPSVSSLTGLFSIFVNHSPCCVSWPLCQMFFALLSTSLVFFSYTFTRVDARVVCSGACYFCFFSSPKSSPRFVRKLRSILSQPIPFHSLFNLSPCCLSFFWLPFFYVIVAFLFELIANFSWTEMLNLFFFCFICFDVQALKQSKQSFSSKPDNVSYKLCRCCFNFCPSTFPVMICSRTPYAFLKSTIVFKKHCFLSSICMFLL